MSYIYVCIYVLSKHSVMVVLHKEFINLCLDNILGYKVVDS